MKDLIRIWAVLYKNGDVDAWSVEQPAPAYPFVLEYKVENKINELEEEINGLVTDCNFLLSLVSNWAKKVPKGLDPTFYGTLTYEGDIKVKTRIDKIKTTLKEIESRNRE